MPDSDVENGGPAAGPSPGGSAAPPSGPDPPEQQEPPSAGPTPRHLRQRKAGTCSVCSTHGSASLAGGGSMRDSMRRAAAAAGSGYELPSGPPQWWPWRGRGAPLHRVLCALLESPFTHIVVIALVVLDLCIVVTELILSSTYCDKEATPHAVHTAEDVLRWVSISILILFQAELVGKLLVFGPRYFLNSWLHMLDAVVVTTSLVLELALHGVAEEVVGLLVFFRLWRIIRIMHSLTEVLELQHEEEVEAHHKALEALQQELKAERQRAQQLELQLAGLRRGGAGGGGASALR